LFGADLPINERKVGITSKVEISTSVSLFGGIFPGNLATAGIRKFASQTEPSPVSSPQGTPSNSSSVSGSTHLRGRPSVGRGTNS
jgi:hypothetical protein